MHVLIAWIDVILVVLAVCLLVVVFYPSVVSYIPVVTHPQASKVALILFILIVSGVILRQGGSVVLFDYFQLRLPTPTQRVEAEERALALNDMVTPSPIAVLTPILQTLRPSITLELVSSTSTVVPPMRSPVPTVPATATVPAVIVWQSGDTSKSHAPRSGEVCWGAQVGKLERRDVSYVVYFAQDTAEIVITNGACEAYGRSLNAIATQLQSEYPQISWQVVSDYANTPARPPTVVWQSGAQEQRYDPQAGETCWGTYVGRYRDAGVSYVVFFARDNGAVAIFNGACERYGRSFADIVQSLQSDYPAIRWVVVDGYQE